MKNSSILDSSLLGSNFVKEVAPRMRGHRKDRQVELKCTICSHNFIVSLANAKRIQQKTCSNECAGILRRKSDEGNLNHPMYNRWLSMRDRCNNPNNDRYLRYGARGITYEASFDDFNVYAKYCLSLPGCPIDISNSNLEVDRINNDTGYFIGNLRWATSAIQAANKSLDKLSKHTSSTVGVCWCTTNKRWIARVQFNNKILHQSSHLSEIEATHARQQYIIDNNLPHQIK